MLILGALKKPRFVGQVFSLTPSLGDGTGRHNVTIGSGVTSVSGKAQFNVGNGGFIALNDGLNTDKDFSPSLTGDFDVSFKFQMTADPDTLSLLFAFGDSSGSTGANIFCYVGVTGGGLRVNLVGGGLSTGIQHPTIQVVGSAEQTVLMTRRGLTYTLTVDGTFATEVASTLPPDTTPSNLLIGAWTAQGAIWDFVGTIRDFIVTKV